MAGLLLTIVTASVLASGAGVPYERLDPTQPGLRVRLNFPAASTVNENRLTYRLGPGGDLIVDVQTSLGPDAVKPPQVVRLAVTVDARQVPFRIANGRATREHSFSFSAVGQLEKFTVRVARRELAANRSSVALLFYRADGGAFPSASFVVEKGAGGFRSRTFDASLRVEPPTGRTTIEM